MPQNPFQPPTAPTLDQGGSRVGTFDIGQCFSDAWRLTWANFGVLLGAIIVGGIVYLISAITIIGIVVVLPVLAWGFVKLLLNAYDQKAEFGDLFSGFSRYGEALASMLVLFICIFLLAIVGQSVSFVGAIAKSSVIQGIGSLVSLVWSFTVMLRLYFGSYFIVDQGMGGVDSLKASWAATSEQKLNTFLLALLSGVVAFIGILALGIGIFASAPMSMLMWISAYKQMTGQSRSA
jgi:uncharacterized membrane protein